MILNQYWGQTQSVLGATLLEGNPILKIREGYVGISDVDAFSGVLEKSPTSVSQNLGDGSSWLNLNNIKTNDDSYSVCNIPGQNFAVDIDQDLNAVSVYGALYSGYRTGQAQSFFLGQTKLLYQCSFWLRRYGVTTGNLYASFYNDSGSSYGINSKPGTSFYALSASRSYVTISSSSFTEYSFDFSGSSPVYILPNVKYCVAIGFSGGGPSSYIGVGFEESNGHSGNASVFVTGIGWTPRSNLDVPFTVSEVGTTGSLTTSIGAYSNGFSLPSNFSINGIEVGIKVGVSCGAGEYIKDNTIQLHIDGINYSAENKSNGTTLVGGATYIVYGGISEFWGETWGVSNINDSDFGPYIRFVGRGTALIDHVYTKVFYSGETSGNYTRYSNLGKYLINNINYGGYDTQSLNLAGSRYDRGLFDQRSIVADNYVTKFGWINQLGNSSYLNVLEPSSPGRWGLTLGILWTRYTRFNGTTYQELAHIKGSEDSEDYAVSIKFPAIIMADSGLSGVVGSDSGSSGRYIGLLIRNKDSTPGKDTYLKYAHYPRWGISPEGHYKIESWVNGQLVSGVCYGSGLGVGEDDWYVNLAVYAKGSNYIFYYSKGETNTGYPGYYYPTTQFYELTRLVDSRFRGGGVDLTMWAEDCTAWTSTTERHRVWWSNLGYYPISTINNNFNVVESLVKSAGDFILESWPQEWRSGITDMDWMGMVVNNFTQPPTGVSIYENASGRILMLNSGNSGAGFRGISLFCLYKVTGESYSDFVFDVDILSYDNNTAGTKFSFICGSSTNYFGLDFRCRSYPIPVSLSYQFEGPTVRKIAGVSIVDLSWPPHELTRIEKDVWYRVTMAKLGNQLSWYLNKNLISICDIDANIIDINFVRLGFGAWGVSESVVLNRLLFRNPRINRLDAVLEEQRSGSGDMLSASLAKYVPYGYNLGYSDDCFNLNKLGASGGVIGISEYYRIAETKNYGRFAKYVYAKGDEVAASNLSDQDRLTKDASINEWIDYQDSNLKTETMAKELGADKLKEKNDDSELYSMVNLPNVLLEKGDKVNVVDEGLGISKQYLVDTHLKRWTANGEFIQYTGLVRDDT